MHPAWPPRPAERRARRGKSSRPYRLNVLQGLLARDGIIAEGPGRHLSPPIAAWRTLGRERRRLERRGRTATLWRSEGAIRNLRQPERCRARGGGDRKSVV